MPRGRCVYFRFQPLVPDPGNRFMNLPRRGIPLPVRREVCLVPPSLLLGACLLLAGVVPALAANLQGSMTSVRRQSRVAQEHDFTYLNTPGDVQRFVDQGILVRVSESGTLRLEGVSYPYARPEVLLFLKRLSGQYYRACGEQLVVTSLVRPRSKQPRNASTNSVHPTGMAIDIRRSNNRASRRWLEKNLLVLEDRGVIEATLERRPPHYHVAVFPNPYAQYVAAKTGGRVPEPGSGDPTGIPDNHQVYRVRSGDSLWVIARRFGTSVGDIRRANELRSSRIYPGQTLRIPGD